MRAWHSAWVDWGRFFASMPLVLLVILLSREVSLRLAFGYWPAGSEYYPSSRLARIVLDIHEFGLVLPGFWLTFMCVPLWIVTAAASRPALGELGRQALVFLLGVALLIASLAKWRLPF
jgi:hypothetical protein